MLTYMSYELVTHFDLSLDQFLGDFWISSHYSLTVYHLKIWIWINSVNIVLINSTACCWSACKQGVVFLFLHYPPDVKCHDGHIASHWHITEPTGFDLTKACFKCLCWSDKRHKTGGTYYQGCMYPTNSAWPAFLMPFLLLLPVSGHLSHGFTVPQQSVPTLRYTCRYLPSAVPWISEDRLFCQWPFLNILSFGCNNFMVNTTYSFVKFINRPYVSNKYTANSNTITVNFPTSDSLL